MRNPQGARRRCARSRSLHAPSIGPGVALLWSRALWRNHRSDPKSRFFRTFHPEFTQWPTLLGWPQGTFASKVEVSEGATVTREVDGGLETVKLNLPAVVTTDLRLNEPRYASLPNIMKAKSKPLATKSPGDYGVDVARRLETVKVTEPAKRQAGIKVGNVDELVERLKGLGIAK
jgi:hypothetical protein